MTAGSFLLQTTFAPYAQELSADPTAGAQHTPGITAAPNGVPMVNIARPNGSGLSHNKFNDFNVGQQGLILNNSKVVGTSQLGGAILGNPNLASGSTARIILNEVTSANPSLLEGATEVFGGTADYVLANPNGITCNGCGFINTPRATLTTGTPVLDPTSGALTGLSVNDGAISIGALGLDARSTDYFDVISRSVAINGAIHGKDVRVITGRNDIDYANRVVKSVKADDGSDKPEFSIDSSALGGMYANRISLEGTEAGVGVRTPEKHGGRCRRNGADRRRQTRHAESLVPGRDQGPLEFRGRRSNREPPRCNRPRPDQQCQHDLPEPRDRRRARQCGHRGGSRCRTGCGADRCGHEYGRKLCRRRGHADCDGRRHHRRRFRNNGECGPVGLNERVEPAGCRRHRERL
ncbi:filamentous hemagglutinin N-terminal domain-containing protein [Roseibium salinum]|nr:filamentous hemagglutinin N-terminal domain-containing protein [Roseibium salinum]